VDGHGAPKKLVGCVTLQIAPPILFLCFLNISTMLNNFFANFFDVNGFKNIVYLQAGPRNRTIFVSA